MHVPINIRSTIHSSIPLIPSHCLGIWQSKESDHPSNMTGEGRSRLQKSAWRCSAYLWTDNPITWGPAVWWKLLPQGLWLGSILQRWSGQYRCVPCTLIRADSWLHPRLLAQELPGKEKQGCYNLSVWTFMFVYQRTIALSICTNGTHGQIIAGEWIKKCKICVNKTVNAEWYKTDLTFTTDERMGTEFFKFWLVSTYPLCCGSNLVQCGEHHNNVLH